MKRFALSYKTIKWLLLLALFISLVPILLMGIYAVPAADDFSYGAPAHIAYVESGSIGAAAAAAVDKTVESYFSWQGSFAAIFLMALQPAVFSESLYALTPFIMLFSLVLGTFLFCRGFFGELLGLDKELPPIIAALLCILSVQLIPSPVQGLYWFNGAVYYVFFHGLMLIFCAMSIRLILKSSRLCSLGLCVLGFILGGGNYVTALSLTILVICAMTLLLIMKDSRWRRLLLPTFFLLASFALNIAAPGNSVRQAAQEISIGPVRAILMSFQQGISYSVQWLSLPVLGMLVFLGIILWKPLGGSGFHFRFPALLTLFSYCIFSAMFCPPIYALGNVGDKRLLNIIYFAWLLLLAINLCYWLGWFAKRILRSSSEKASLSFSAFAAACIVLLGCCAGSLASGTGFSSLAAMGSLLSGEAKAYHDCAQRRFEVLNDDSVKAARLERFPCQPYLLFFDDITEDPKDWRNEDMSSFYGKDSVILD